MYYNEIVESLENARDSWTFFVIWCNVNVCVCVWCMNAIVCHSKCLKLNENDLCWTLLMHIWIYTAAAYKNLYPQRMDNVNENIQSKEHFFHPCYNCLSVVRLLFPIESVVFCVLSFEILYLIREESWMYEYSSCFCCNAIECTIVISMRSSYSKPNDDIPFCLNGIRWRWA